MKVVVGTKQLRKAVKNNRARYVFLAENADPAVTDPLADLCRENHIQITWVRSMAELGRACGIEVGAAAAAVLSP
nr:ribosomal L7Ae/L30e/S12e/Gadd45 family protein [Oscillospiraceae bacterium]